MKKFLYLFTCIALCLGACKKEQVPERNIGINGIYYKTVLLGDKTWTAENYRGPGGVDLAGNTDYGKLYTIAEAQQVTLPKGWRIPTTNDFYQLMTLTGAGDPNLGYKNMVQSQLVTLMSTSGWSVQNGTNTTGFNAFPGGYYALASGSFVWQEYKNLALFLTNTGNGNGTTLGFAFGLKSDGTVVANNSSVLATVNDRAALRFVKDN